MLTGRCKDQIGRPVRLCRDIVYLSGRVLKRGTLGRVVGTWRGRFTVEFSDGLMWARSLSRSSLTIVEDNAPK